MRSPRPVKTPLAACAVALSVALGGGCAGRHGRSPAVPDVPVSATTRPGLTADPVALLVGDKQGFRDYGRFGYGNGSATLVLLAGGRYSLTYFDSGLFGAAVGRWQF